MELLTGIPPQLQTTAATSTPQLPPNAQMPAQLFQTFAQFQAANQQLAAHRAALGNHQGLQHNHQLNPVQGVPNGLPPVQGLPLPQQLHGPLALPTNPSPNPHIHHPFAHQHNHLQPNQVRHVVGQAASNPNTYRPSSAPPPGMGNSNTLIREHVGPNGERWQTITQSGSVQVNHGQPRQVLQSNFPVSGDSGMPRSNSSPGVNAPRSGILASTPNHREAPFQHVQVTNSHLHSINVVLQSLHNHFTSLEAFLNNGSVPSDSWFENGNNHLQFLAVNIPPQQYQPLITRHVGLLNRAANLRTDLDTQLRRYADSASTHRRNESASEPSTIYLLSSPTGPHALLLSPSGNYTSPWPITHLPLTQHGIPANPLLAPHSVYANSNGVAGAYQPPILPIQATAPVPPNQQADAGPGVQALPAQQVQRVQRARQNQNANQVRDIVRIIIPLGGHLWLLVRLFGFVYFFTHGASWQRTILLSLVALLLFLAQTGAFRPFIQHVWDPIRRHVEAVLPLAGDDQGRRQPQPVRNRDGPAAPTLGSQEFSSEQATERLLQERAGQDGNIIRQGLRRVERAIALFVASLVPGVGERHIAAREAVEAARQAEEREREERERRGQEERQQQQQEQAQDSGISNTAVDGAAQVDNGQGSSLPPGSEGATSAPLIET